MGRLVFFGNERLATGITTSAPTLQALLTAGHEVVAVVSHYERGTSRSARTLEIMAIAEAHNIPVLLPEKPIDILEQLKGFHADAAILVAYGKIVPQSIIDIFPKGIINIHPSLLPLHRGPIPVESVILEGASKTGVSVMQLVKAMDAGPVFGQTEIQLTGAETKQALADKLLIIGGKMVIDLLPGILDSSTILTPQNNDSATYDKMISKLDGKLDWNKSAEQLEREIRAYAAWPKSYTTLAGKDVIVTKVHAVETHNANTKPGKLETAGDAKTIIITTGSGSICIEKLKPSGKNEMSGTEFLTGYGKDI
jgi:methionyl-tRNA formyltransferase